MNEDAPTAREAAAAMAAADTFGRKMHPRRPRMVRDLPRLLDEMIAAAQRTRAVIHEGGGGSPSPRPPTRDAS